MIVYNPRRCCGLVVLSSFRGSSLPFGALYGEHAAQTASLPPVRPSAYMARHGRAVPRDRLMLGGVFAGTFSVLIVLSMKIKPINDSLWSAMNNNAHVEIDPAAFAIFSTIVGFLVVFRCNLAYSRFWEARTQIQAMSTHWADLASHVVSCDSGFDVLWQKQCFRG